MTLEQAVMDPRSSVSEAYYSVRTALQFSTPTGVPDVLLVTSSRAAEGKSTTSRVIAQNFARLGMRVLLVDADLRNPSLHRMLGRDNARDLSNLLTGEGVEHVVLDRHGIASTWERERWDSFTLLTPNWATWLPGCRRAAPRPASSTDALASA